MLTPYKVLSANKRAFGFPYTDIELSDKELLDLMQDSLEEFSEYIPAKNRIGMNLGNADIQVPDIEHQWYIVEPNGLEILNIVEIIFPFSGEAVTGHPLIGAWGVGDLKEWALAVENSKMAKQFSIFDYHWEFINPNILDIRPHPGSCNITVVYEHFHDPDLSTIPIQYQSLFKDFAFADMQMVIGMIRKKYGGGTLRTQFGDIPLDGDQIYNEGKDSKDKLKELLKTNLPNITIDIG